MSEEEEKSDEEKPEEEVVEEVSEPPSEPIPEPPKKNLGEIFDESSSSDSFKEINHYKTYLEWLESEK